MILKNIKPIGDVIITTADKYEDVYTESGLLDPSKSGGYKPYQTVLFVSDMVEARGIKVGDVVIVNYDNYAAASQKKIDSPSTVKDEYYNATVVYHLCIVDINREECLKLRYNDIEAIILDMEEEKAPEKKVKNTFKGLPKSNIKLMSGNKIVNPVSLIL